MRSDPFNFLGEILGEPAREMTNPANADYQCPFMTGQCIKRSHKFNDPFPVCSVWAGGFARGPKSERRLITLCPKRFNQIDIVGDVLAYCWPGKPPSNPRISGEVTMANFGRVDFVIADVVPGSNEVERFVSVELQAADITGSYEPAYQAALQRSDEVEVTYGINWKNVQKRYVSQLIQKGIYHHHWGSRIVAILQAPIYRYLKQNIKFDEIPLADATASHAICFMLYDYEYGDDEDAEVKGTRNLKLEKVVATSHSSLMMAALYQDVPSKLTFCELIRRNLL